MRNRRTLAIVAGCAAVLLAAPGMGQDASRPFHGPLKPDLPLAKAYNDSARAMSMADENPLIRWEYRVWCETGYRSVGDEGTGQEVDKPIDPLRDMVSPKGFFHTENARTLMPPGGARFLDNAWYFGANGLGVVVVKTPDGLLLFDAMTTPEEFEQTVLNEMPRAGLDPKDIKYVFVGHHHADHTGGVNVMRRIAPKAKVVAGAPDAAVIDQARKALLADDLASLPEENHALIKRNARPKTAEEAAKLKAARLAALPGKIDILVQPEPGLKTGTLSIRVGPHTQVMAVLAPGHTVGQMQVIVPVMHQGKMHSLIVMSGNDQPSEAAQYAISTDYTRSVASALGVDALINTHAYQSAMFYYLRELAANPAAPNPFLMGTDGVNRFLGVFAECQRAMDHRLKDGTWLAF